MKLKLPILASLLAIVISMAPAMAYTGFDAEMPLYYIMYFIWALHPASVVTIPVSVII